MLKELPERWFEKQGPRTRSPEGRNATLKSLDQRLEATWTCVRLADTVEIAQVLGIPPCTVSSKWAATRFGLRSDIHQGFEA